MGTHYALSCPECGRAGSAEHWAARWSYSNRPAWGLNVSYGFDLAAPMPSEPPTFALACVACGTRATWGEIDYVHFFPDEPAMRPVAGSCEKARRRGPQSY